MVGYSERLRVELQADGIGVSVLCPSGVRTRITESRRNRQAQFGGAVETRPAAYANRADVLEPEAVGALVLRGVRENRLYIHTHRSFRPRYEERFAQILADFAPLES